MPRSNPPRSNGTVWEVNEVERDDHGRFRLNCGCYYVTIVSIREFDRRYTCLVSGNEALRIDLVHEGTCSLQLRTREIGSVRQDVTYPFIVNLLRPSRSVKPSRSQP